MRFLVLPLLLLLSVPVAHAEVSRLDSIAKALDAFDQKIDRAVDDFERGSVYKKQTFGERKIQTLDMGWEPYYYEYWEDIPIKIKGMMNSFYANYTYRPPDENPLNNPVLNAYMLEFRYATGELDYKGSGTMSDKRNNNLELRMLLGKEYVLSSGGNALPYFGFGYRTLDDEGSGRLTSSGHYGYDRHSMYLYLPVGVRFNVPYKQWRHSVGVEYDFFLGGEQVSDLSAGTQWNGFDNPNVHNDQSKGFGARASYRLAYVTPKAEFYVEPFIRFWNIEDSEVVNAVVDGSNISLYEPHNTTTEIGSKIGMQF